MIAMNITDHFPERVKMMYFKTFFDNRTCSYVQVHVVQCCCSYS